VRLIRPKGGRGPGSDRHKRRGRRRALIADDLSGIVSALVEAARFPRRRVRGNSAPDTQGPRHLVGQRKRPIRQGQSLRVGLRGLLVQLEKCSIESRTRDGQLWILLNGDLLCLRRRMRGGDGLKRQVRVLGTRHDGHQAQRRYRPSPALPRESTKTPCTSGGSKPCHITKRHPHNTLLCWSIRRLKARLKWALAHPVECRQRVSMERCQQA